MMDAEVREEIDHLRARIEAVESVLADIEDGALDPIVKQLREFAAKVRARREAQE